MVRAISSDLTIWIVGRRWYEMISSIVDELDGANDIWLGAAIGFNVVHVK